MRRRTDAAFTAEEEELEPVGPESETTVFSLEELGDLLVKTLHDLDRLWLEAKDKVAHSDALAILGDVRKVYTDTLAAGCELIGASEDDWECIFDVDRPVSEWNLLNHLDLFEGAD